MNRYTSLVAAALATVLASCSAPPKVEIPALTPQTAGELMQVNPKAKVWLEHIRKQNPACTYKLDLPDQISHPTTVDIDHAVSCGTGPSPRELDAAVSFAYDKDSGHWVITRFSS